MFSPVYTCNVPVVRCARAHAYSPCTYVRERGTRVGSVHGTVKTGVGRPASEFKLQRVTRRIGVGNVCPRICRLREFIAYSVAGLAEKHNRYRVRPCFLYLRPSALLPARRSPAVCPRSRFSTLALGCLTRAPARTSRFARVGPGERARARPR